MRSHILSFRRALRTSLSFINFVMACRIWLCITLYLYTSIGPTQGNFTTRGSRKITPRVTGGRNAIINEFPSMIQLRFRSDQTNLCGGVLISNRHILTAADCFNDDPLLRTFQAVAGLFELGCKTGVEQERDLVAFVRHPQFKYPFRGNNDLAIVQVNPPYEMHHYAKPANLPTPGHVPTGMATVAGYGRLFSYGPNAFNLMANDKLGMTDIQSCNSSYEGTVIDSQLCYGSGGNNEGCQGDSGGPLFCQDENKTLCGIVGARDDCGEINRPGLYTKVSAYLDFINFHITNHPEDATPKTIIDVCGGYFETTSGRIELKQATSYEHCLIAVKVPYDNVRVRLLPSTQLEADNAVYIANTFGTEPTINRTRLEQLLTDYVIPGGLILFIVSMGEPEGGKSDITIEFFSSGYGDKSVPFTKVFFLDALSNENFTYPSGGESYHPEENLLLVISPSRLFSPITTHVYLVDIDLPETDPRCPRDYMQFWRWEKSPFHGAGTFMIKGRYCGTETGVYLPFTLIDEIGLIQFHSSEFGQGKGFTIEISRDAAQSLEEYKQMRIKAMDTTHLLSGKGARKDKAPVTVKPTPPPKKSKPPPPAKKAKGGSPPKKAG